MNRPAAVALATVGLFLVIALVVKLRSGPTAPPSDALVLDVTTSRYRFDPGTDQPINVTLGQTVVLRLRSSDVTHGFAIDAYGINVEVPPGDVVEVRFTADRAGDFAIYCTVFCGAGHPEHKGTLHVA